MAFGLSKKERQAKAKKKAAENKKALKQAADEWNKKSEARKKADRRWK